MAGDRDQMHGVVCMFPAQVASDLEAVHLGHADIHNDNVGRLNACGLKCALSAKSHPGLKAPKTDQIRQAFRRIQPVIDHKDVKMMFHVPDYPPKE